MRRLCGVLRTRGRGMASSLPPPDRSLHAPLPTALVATAATHAARSSAYVAVGDSYSATGIAPQRSRRRTVRPSAAERRGRDRAVLVDERVSEYWPRFRVFNRRHCGRGALDETPVMMGTVHRVARLHAVGDLRVEESDSPLAPVQVGPPSPSRRSGCAAPISTGTPKVAPARSPSTRRWCRGTSSPAWRWTGRTPAGEWRSTRRSRADGASRAARGTPTSARTCGSPATRPSTVVSRNACSGLTSSSFPCRRSSATTPARCWSRWASRSTPSSTRTCVQGTTCSWSGPALSAYSRARSRAARVPRGSSCPSRSSIVARPPCASVRTRPGRRTWSRTS